MYQTKISPAEFCFAREKPKQKLHLVEDLGNGRVSTSALCGRRADWAVTCNIPYFKVCLRCWNSKYLPTKKGEW